MQESLLNPKAGVTADISDPIITGKNITLNAKSFGKELAPKTYSDLSNIKTLEKLAGAKGGDVTFNSNGSITLTEQSPITVAQSTTDDRLNVTTQGNTFISGTAGTKFNVTTPIDAGDGKVVFMTGNGIDARRGITAKDFELYAGAGDLNVNLTAGTKNVMMTVNEPVTITTITYSAGSFFGIDLFDEYKNLPGFSVQTGGSNIFDRTYTLTAIYSPDDTAAVNALERAMKAVNAFGSRALRDDKKGTRPVEKMMPVKDDAGTLTANAAGDININADSTLPVKNITSGSSVNVNAAGNIVPADGNSAVKAPNVNLTATNDIATDSTPLTVNADNTALRAKYAYILGDYGNLNAAGTTVVDKNKKTVNGTANGLTNNSPAFFPVTNNYGLFYTESVANTAAPATVFGTSQSNDLYKVALALSQSSALTNKSGDDYDAAARAWLNGMGYSAADEQFIINLSLEIAFNNLSSKRLLNDGIADIAAKYSGFNTNTKSVA